MPSMPPPAKRGPLPLRSDGGSTRNSARPLWSECGQSISTRVLTLPAAERSFAYLVRRQANDLNGQCC